MFSINNCKNRFPGTVREIRTFPFKWYTAYCGMISEQTIAEFQGLVKRKYGREITLEEAWEILHDLTDYYFTLHLIDSLNTKAE